VSSTAVAPTRTVQGVEVPLLGYGTWEVTGDDCVRGVRHALDVGYRHVDTAQIYGNEAEVGRAIADSDVDRDEVFLTTKVWFQRAAAADVVSSTERSLAALGVDHVDLLLIHWPTDVAPVEETLEAMHGLQQRGLTRLIGVSNYPSSLLRRALGVAPIATNQVEYHPFLSQRAVLDVLAGRDAFLTAYSPLAHGAALGDETLARIAEAHGVTGPQVALRWLLQQDAVVPLPRSRTPEHITANLDVFGFELSEAEVAEIEALPKDRRQIDPPFAPEWD
jgi:2,5-diketo-D-gluconate reductase B